MKKYIIELDTTDVVKLISICNSAIVREEETLRNLSRASQQVITKASIDKIWEIKSKLQNAVAIP